MTNSEEVIKALEKQLSDYFSDELKWTGGKVTIKRNSTIPDTIEDGGLIIVRDGEPGKPEQTLGCTSYYYTHAAEIEIFVSDSDDAKRDELWSVLLSNIGKALEEDKTLNGIVFGMTYGAPSNDVAPVEGAEDIKNGVLKPLIEYVSNTPI